MTTPVTIRIPTGDGPTLAADLFRPAGAGPWPALVALLPYRRDSVAGAALWPLLRDFAARGYACLLVDPRGMGSSDGPARPPFDPTEVDDGVATVSWTARQPWCTGAVGMWGFSYGALLALRTAAHAAPGLKAVMALMPLLDPERDYVHPGGAAGCVTARGMWAMGTLTNALLPPLADHHDPAEQRRWRERLARLEPYGIDLHRHPPGHPTWRDRAVDIGTIVTPVLCVGGTRDMFVDATVRLYEGLRGPRKLLLGPWSHSLPGEASRQPADLAAIATRWWDRWLRDEPNGVDTEPPITVYVHNGDWCDVTELVPPGEPLRLEPDRPSPGYDPTVGARGGLWGIPHGSGEPLDQHGDDLRSLTFTGPPLAQSLLLLGRAEVTLPGTGRTVVKLAHVDPHGDSRLISGGIGTGPTVRLEPTAYRVPAGHRLRVALHGGSFPRWWPQPMALADPGPVTLSLPVAPDDHGRPATVPAAATTDPMGLWRWYEPRWEIRDRPGHSLAVRLGEAFAATLPRGEVTVESQVDTISTVHLGGTAHVRGESHTTATLGTGERVQVRVSLRLTPDSLSLTGRVSIDDDVIVDRHWLG